MKPIMEKGTLHNIWWDMDLSLFKLVPLFFVRFYRDTKRRTEAVVGGFNLKNDTPGSFLGLDKTKTSGNKEHITFQNKSPPTTLPQTDLEKLPEGLCKWNQGFQRSPGLPFWSEGESSSQTTE